MAAPFYSRVQTKDCGVVTSETGGGVEYPVIEVSRFVVTPYQHWMVPFHRLVGHKATQYYHHSWSGANPEEAGLHAWRVCGCRSCTLHNNHLTSPTGDASSVYPSWHSKKAPKFQHRVVFQWHVLHRGILVWNLKSDDGHIVNHLASPVCEECRAVLESLAVDYAVKGMKSESVAGERFFAAISEYCWVDTGIDHPMPEEVGVMLPDFVGPSRSVIGTVK